MGPEAVAETFRVGVVGLLAAVHAAVSDLRATQGASVLAVNGAVGDDDSGADRFATSFAADGRSDCGLLAGTGQDWLVPETRAAHLSGPRPGSGPSDGAKVSSNRRCERWSTGSVTVS